MKTVARLFHQKEIVPPPVPPVVESLAQRYVARLVSAKTSVPDNKKNEEPVDSTDTCDYREVDVASLELFRPRSVGVEHLGLAALSWLGLPEVLEGVGFDGIQRNCALSSIIGRMDRGIATQANIDWLVEPHYRYLVVSREQNRFFDESQAVETTTADKEAIKIQRVVSEDNSEVRLYCYSGKRDEKEQAMSRRFSQRFEEGLTKLAAGLEKPRTNKNYDKFMERIGRLKEKSHGIAKHYTITVTSDDSGAKATSLTWEKKPVDGTQLTHPGVCCLRSNEMEWDKTRLWQTYTMLTDLEAVFRCLKSELGLRPVFHHKEHRAEGHLFITVLAYQAVQAIRSKLNDMSWSSLKEILSVQQRVTATFIQRDGKTLHVRKATVAEPKLKEIYAKLGITPSPGGTKKLVC